MTAARPQPLRDAATSQTTPTLASGGLSALILTAIITRGQFDLIAGGLAAVVVVLNIATPLLTAHRTARVGERAVTPNSSPQADDGTPLVRQEGPLIVEALLGVLDQFEVLRTEMIARPVAGTPVTSTTALPPVPQPSQRYEQYDPARYSDPASTRLPPPTPEPVGRHGLRER